MRRPWLAVLALAAGALLVAGFIASARVSEQRRHARDLAELSARHAALRDSLRAVVGRDPMIARARFDTSAVAVALSDSLLATWIRDIAGRYLDEVALDMKPELHGHGDGELEVGTPFGKMTAGDWKVQVDLHQLEARLSAEPPRVATTGTNRVGVELPIRIEEGHGRLTLDFDWDSRGLFNAVCKDFGTTRTISGVILPQQHRVRGHLVLYADSTGIVARPDFPRVKYPLSMTLDEGSWAELKQALEERDQLAECGLMMNPDTVIAKLRAMGVRGLRFGLPRAAFRTIVLPASVSQSVRILERPVRLVVRPQRLRITPGLVWYSARVAASRSAGPDSLLPWPAAQPQGPS
jgi:hypothetical protein